jgi:hypothetical protein
MIVSVDIISTTMDYYRCACLAFSTYRHLLSFHITKTNIIIFSCVMSFVLLGCYFFCKATQVDSILLMSMSFIQIEEGWWTAHNMKFGLWNLLFHNLWSTDITQWHADTANNFKKLYVSAVIDTFIHSMLSHMKMYKSSMLCNIKWVSASNIWLSF